MQKILITGAMGQIGTELTIFLRERYGSTNVVISGRAEDAEDELYETVDVMDCHRLAAIVSKHKINTIYHLAAILSAVGEHKPKLAWDVNVKGTYNVLEVAKEAKCAVFVPSSIAAFGPGTPSVDTPQDTMQRPTSMYGITKVAGELLADYYHAKFGVDVRGVRYPGLISYSAPPGGGTTDYAVEIFYEAIQKRVYTCYLKSDARLPMMYMPDALQAAVELMEADGERLQHRNSFNVAAFSLTPAELAGQIQKHIPDFQMLYEVDPVKQAIADSWPQSLDDSAARREWDWRPHFSLEEMVSDMLVNLGRKLKG